MRSIAEGGLRMWRLLAEWRLMISFLSRWPTPAAEVRGGDAFARALRAAPLAGAAIALIPALLLGLSVEAGTGPMVAAALAVSASLWSTGALHEDGLADVADGFGGGATPERKLAIMRDSRVGSFGVLALTASFFLRVACLAHLAEGGGWRAAGALVAAATVSRAAMLLPLRLLPKARPDGLARAVGTLDNAVLAVALAIAMPVTLIVARATATGSTQALAADSAAIAAAGLVTWLARRQIGGVTGDVVGAAQQGAEVAFLIVLCVTRSPL